jgi:hypothetical protein
MSRRYFLSLTVWREPGPGQQALPPAGRRVRHAPKHWMTSASRSSVHEDAMEAFEEAGLDND